MNKVVKLIIFTVIILAIAAGAYFTFFKEYVPIEIKQIELLPDSTFVDTSVVDTNIFEMLPLDSGMVEIMDKHKDTLYYVIVGSFKIEMNAINFSDVTDNSSIVYNDSYHMVYIYKSHLLNEAIQIRVANLESYNDSIWIYKGVE